MTTPKRNNIWNLSHNCGSYALNTTEWVTPFDEDVDERIEFIYEIIKETQSVEIARELILNMDTSYLKEVFNLKEISKQEILEWARKTEIIAYRIYLKAELSDNGDFSVFDPIDIDYDFHFRLLKDGVWSEKCGELPINIVTTGIKDEWDVFPLKDSSNIRYFIKF